MEIIRQNRLIAAILGGLVVMAALVLILNDGSDSPDIPTSDLPTSTGSATVATTDAPALTRPDVRTLKCDTLLPSDAVHAALGNPTGWGTTAFAEDCRHESNTSAATIQIAPGSPADFDPGAQIFGVPGTPVEGVGDLALWFGGPTANGDGGVGAIVVAANTDIGALVYRIAVGRPDLDPDAQLEIAKDLARAALPRFPGVTPAVPEATPTPEPNPLPVITIEHEPVDLAGLSYANNLLAREADGEWTRGEGLVATLQLLAGELDPSEVLRAGSVLDDSATDVARLADAYLASAQADPESAATIDRLLAALYPTGPTDTTTAARATQSSARAISILGSQTPGCYVAFPATDDSCWEKSAVSPDLFGERYSIWTPDLPEGSTWEGWTIGDGTLADALATSAITLEGLTGQMPVVEFWLSPDLKRSVRYTPGVCRVFAGADVQQVLAQGAPLAQQLVAAMVSHCYIFENLTAGSHLDLKWWESGISLYISDVIYPDAAYELVQLDIPTKLGSVEAGTTLTQRSLTNMPFFEYVGAQRGLQGTVDLVAEISFGGLESVTQIDELWHTYVRDLTAGTILDRGTVGFYQFRPAVATYDISEPGSILVSPRAFGQKRVHLVIQAGSSACLEYEDEGSLDMLVSFSGHAPGSSTSWTAKRNIFANGDLTIVVTNTQPDSRLYINVTKVVEGDECSETEGDSGSGDGSGAGGDVDDRGDDNGVPVPEPPCGGCPRTSFYSDWNIPERN